MTTITAKIVADSIGDDAPRLTTRLLRYPRKIHAEFMTHRVFSRNASSSRALPFAKLHAEAFEDPALPLFWMAESKGMHSGRFITDPKTIRALESEWFYSRDEAAARATNMHKLGLHKSECNRLLEPYTHITVVVSATQWSNFDALRRHGAADPHIELLAERMKESFDASTPSLLKPGRWHLPFVNAEDRENESRRMHVSHRASDKHVTDMNLLKLSVARCASTSYKTVDGFDMTLERAIALHDKLVVSTPLHASPAEHQARVDEIDEGWPADDTRNPKAWAYPELRGNLGPGWIQYRKTLAGECQ